MFCDRRFRRCLIEMALGDTTVDAGGEVSGLAITFDAVLPKRSKTLAGAPWRTTAPACKPSTVNSPPASLLGLGQVDLRQGLLHVRRRKNGLPSTHPLRGPELRALRKLLRDDPDTAYVFVSERRAPMTAATFRKLIARAGDAASLGMPIHPHMLRHSTGFKLANDGQDTRAIQLYLGHKNIQYTALYTQLAPDHFNDFWTN